MEKKHSLGAFILGILCGWVGIPVLMHIFYIFIILMLLMVKH